MSFEPIITSFFAPEILAQRIEAAYGFEHVHCQLITATLRDVYLVESRAGRHILIVYRHGQRAWDEIAAEWQLVDYLAQHAVPVAPAIATSTGEQMLTLQAPEGVRYAVVTAYVPGQHLRRRPSVEATRRYGEIIATIHVLADRAPLSFARPTHDIATRLDQAQAGMRAVLGDGLTERAYLEQCGQELHARLQALPNVEVLASSLVILRQLFQPFPLFLFMTKNHQPNLLPFHQIKQLVRAGANRFGVRVAPIVR